MILEVYAKAYLLKAKIVTSSMFTKKGMILAPVIIPISMAKTTGMRIFQLKTFTLLVSDMKLNLVIGVIGFWCIVESYSIFFENFKKMGIDIKSTIKKITDLITFLKDKSNDVCK